MGKPSGLAETPELVKLELGLEPRCSGPQPYLTLVSLMLEYLLCGAGFADV